MRIKKLEIHGFKSFADRAALVFGDGISVVVGPNGCGKSNVVDAVRWCMGEMSAKHLRGKAMQDVIFAGSDSRGPHGFAEVTLTFHNDGAVPPAYAAYPEIAITRRLHRDGTSEYFINRTPSRLRDITDFFLGTGVGTRAYSIIEQGRIGFIVNAKPEERRNLIEDVAGITKFKARKKAAERRMAATEHNLNRVDDIVGELDRQLGSLRRQAKKAARYRELRDEYRDLELHAASIAWLKLAAVERFQLGEQDKLEERFGDTQSSMMNIETTVETDKLSLLEEEEKLTADQQASAEVDARLAALERDLTHWRAEEEAAKIRGRQGSADVATAETRLAHAKEELRQLEEEAGALQGALDDDRGRLTEVVQEAESAQRDVQNFDEKLEALREDVVDRIQSGAQTRSILSTLAERRTDSERQAQQATEEIERVAEQKAKVAAEVVAIEAKLALGRSTLEATRLDHERSRDQRLELDERRRVQAAHTLALRDELAERRSRLGSLVEVARRLEGFSDGVQTLMGQEGRPAIDGIHGVVPEFVEVPEIHERAVEAALGQRLEFMVVGDHRVSRRGIAHLEASGGGRGGFIALDAQGSAATDRLRGGEGTALSDLVRSAPGYEAVVAALLEGCFLVDSLDAALAWPAADRPVLLVTPTGETVDRHGAVVGGYDEGFGVLATRREIRELKATVGELEIAHANASDQERSLEKELADLDERLGELDASIRRGELTVLEQEKNFEALGDEEGRLSERIEILNYDLDRYRDEVKRIDMESTAARDELTQHDTALREAEAQVEQLRARRTVQAEILGERSQVLTGLRVDVAAREQRAKAAQAGIERLARSIEELGERIDRSRSEEQGSIDILTRLAGQIAAGEAELAKMSSQADTLRDTLSERRGAYEKKREALGLSEQKIREERRQGELLNEALVEVKMELQRMALERERLERQVRERYDADLNDILTDYHHRAHPDDEKDRRRGELARQIKSMGAINLTAIDECAEVEERFEFLSRQRQDLNAALENLRRAIKRINRASRERFQEAYEAVNEMFQQVYPRLFRGGVARLELTDADDVLEAGVDIVAQPPGKKLQNVNLLSGGEKALTATAFVFAIFLIKPSPFCILDEVDAPLDEANVGRFTEMLREISSLSQFIVITHNKTTMTQADRLYGITMQEPGMSTVVPVELDGSTKEVQGDDEAA